MDALEKFYSKLAAITAKNRLAWSLSPMGRIRSASSWQCPVMEIGGIKTIESDTRIVAAGAACGLSPEVTAAVVAATDNFVLHDPAIRAALLKACGLETER